MMKDLNWRPLEQRRIDRCLVMMYKITYDLVAIPASEYLIRNTRSSAHRHPLAYRQIFTHRLLQVHFFFSKDYYSLKCSTCQYRKKKRKVQGVPQSQTAALPRPQEEEETDNLNKHKPNKRAKSIKISSLFPSEVIAILKGLKNTRTK